MKQPVFVATIHLQALPGSAKGGPAATMPAILERAMRDAQAYASGGAGAVIVENFGDIPFTKDEVHPHTISAITKVVDAVQRAIDLPVGVNVLRNDVVAAISIAAMTGAQFVRANVYVGAALTDQGVIEGKAEAVQVLIRRLQCDVQIWADIDVKHATQLAPRPLGELAADAVERGLADAVIVTGKATGAGASLSDLQEVRSAIGDHPVYVGSGVTVQSIPALLEFADGAIIGTAAKVDGVATAPVDPARVRALAAAFRQGEA